MITNTWDNENNTIITLDNIYINRMISANKKINFNLNNNDLDNELILELINKTNLLSDNQCEWPEGTCIIFDVLTSTNLLMIKNNIKMIIEILGSESGKSSTRGSNDNSKVVLTLLIRLRKVSFFNKTAISLFLGRWIMNMHKRETIKRIISIE